MINHTHKFIFVKTRKTAGTSLEIALSKFCTSKDMVGFIVPEDEAKRKSMGFQTSINCIKPIWKWSPREMYNYLKRSVPPQYLDEHATAKQIKDFVEPEIWNSYFKFTIARNPYDQIISRYFWETRKEELRPSFKTWLLDNPEKIRQNSNIYMIDGKVAVDQVVRFDNLSTDIRIIADKIGIDEDLYSLMASMKAKSGIRDKKSSPEIMFDGFTRGRNIVELLGEEEIVLLDRLSENL